MKNLTTAALLLACVLFVLPQVSEAGKRAFDKPCEFPKIDPAKAPTCTTELSLAFEALEDSDDGFKSDRTYNALTCKVRHAELKLKKNKTLDAFYIIEDSLLKIRTLISSWKPKLDADVAAEAELVESFLAAESCIYTETQ